MSVIPEEIPVAFSSFMALGAFHLAKLGVISRQPQTVENLGAVSVICLDKTGTITMNEMHVKMLYDYSTGSLIDLKQTTNSDSKVLYYAVLASELNPFDAMEKAIWQAYREQTGNKDLPGMKMIHEYALEGRPPMMTHVYQHDNEKIIAAKGAAEKILNVCRLTEEEKTKIDKQVKSFGQSGFRVLGVASSKLFDEPLPEKQSDFEWQFCGLVCLYDPPKKEIAGALKRFYNAKISVKLLTGDFAETAINIAEQVGMVSGLKFYTGDQVMEMNKEELKEAVKSANIFARMFPEAKFKVIEALKASGEIVAMTGDGVNDAPALKSAHIGIAIGKNGAEIARQAADLIITNDDLNKMADAIEQGRKIFYNLKKAIRYIISIHIPIILTASLPLLLNWKYPNIFTPIHIIFLELIMGPTCSIFYEREPVEKDIMLRHPRNRKQGLFRVNEILISILQGLLIAASALLLYNYYMRTGHPLQETRTIVFTTLVISNIFLTFVNRSFSKPVFTTVRYKNNLALPVFILSILFMSSFLLIPGVRQLFELTAISGEQFLSCLGAAFIATMLFDLYKLLF
jgi:Ca2+-transporting ATPase